MINSIEEKLWKHMNDLRSRGMGGELDALIGFYQENIKEISPNELLSMARKYSSNAEALSPEGVSNLLRNLVSAIKPKTFLDTCSGAGGFIAAAIDASEGKVDIEATEINQQLATFSQKLFEGSKNARVHNSDYLVSSCNHDFDFIASEPPFGMKVEYCKKKTSADIAFIDKSLSILETNGYLFVVVPESFLFMKNNHAHLLRQKIYNEYCVRAILSLPTNAFKPRTAIKTSVLLIQNAKADVSSEFIYADYKDLNYRGESLSRVLFEKETPQKPFYKFAYEELKQEEWLFRNKLPFKDRFGFERVDYPHSKVGDVIDLKPVKSLEVIDDYSLLLRRVGNFKIVAKDDIEKLNASTLRNYSELIVMPDAVDLSYLKLFMSSELFQVQLKEIAKGTVIRAVNAKDILDLQIPLPPLNVQKQIAMQFDKVHSVYESTLRLKNEFLKNPFGKDLVEDKQLIAGVDKFHESLAMNMEECLPTPLASAYRMTKSKTNSKEALFNAITLSDVSIRFLTLSIFAELQSKKLIDDLAQEINVDFTMPSLGKWVLALRGLGKAFSALEKDVTKEMITNFLCVKINSIVKAIDDSKLTNIRNTYQGHASANIPDAVYRAKLEPVEQLNDLLLSVLSNFFKNNKLILIEGYKKKAGRRVGDIRQIMGSNRDFILETMELNAEYETDEVLLLSNDQSNYVSLHPLIAFNTCTECSSENVFFYDSRDKKKTVYYSPVHMHKPKLNYLDEVKAILF